MRLFCLYFRWESVTKLDPTLNLGIQVPKTTFATFYFFKFSNINEYTFYVPEISNHMLRGI